MSAVDLAIYHQHDDIASILLDQGATISSSAYQIIHSIPFKNIVLRKMMDKDNIDSIKRIITQNTDALVQVNEDILLSQRQKRPPKLKKSWYRQYLIFFRINSLRKKSNNPFIEQLDP